jgi:hypothetical protein
MAQLFRNQSRGQLVGIVNPKCEKVDGESPPPSAVGTGRTFGLKFLDLVLLLGSQQREDIGPQVCFENRHLGFGRHEIRGGRADRALVHGRRFDGGAPGIHRGTQPRLDLLAALSPGLREVANLLSLTVGQVQLRKRQPEFAGSSRTTEPTSASTTRSPCTARSLRERRTAREETCDQHASQHSTKSNHGNLHLSALLADCLA